MNHNMPFPEIIDNYSHKVDVKPIESHPSEGCFVFETDSSFRIKEFQEHNSLKTHFKVLNLEFLKMRRNGWPRFAIFSPHVRNCNFTLFFNWQETRVTPQASFEAWLQELYFKDIFCRLAKDAIRIGVKHVRGVTAKLSCGFNGFIPNEKRALIQCWRNCSLPTGEVIPAFDSLYIIKEADKWEYVIEEQEESIIQLVSRDPLVVGIKGSQAYLLDSFDVTPLEYYVGQEFGE